MADLSEQIEDAAKGPKRVTVNGETVEAHGIPDLIEADKHLAAKGSTGKNHFGLRFSRLKMPGAG